MQIDFRELKTYMKIIYFLSNSSMNFFSNALSQLELIKYIQLLAVFQLNSDTFFHECILSDAQLSCNDVI